MSTAVTGRKPSIVINNDLVKGLIRWSFRANPEKIDVTSADSGDYKEYKYGRKDAEITAEVLVDPTDTDFIGYCAAGLTTPVNVEFRADSESNTADISWQAYVVADLDTVGLSAAAKRNVTFVRCGEFVGS